MYDTHVITGRRHATALLDEVFRLRAEVFVDGLKWPLPVDELGREIDDFDHDGSRYVILTRSSRVMASTRLLPCDQPCLLLDRYAFTIARPVARSPQVWEGSRMVVAPGLSAGESGYWAAAVLHEAGKAAAAHGVTRFVTLSDPVMERVLTRAGAQPRRLGPVARDRHGFACLALEIACDSATITRLKSKGMNRHTERKAA